eukprot:TRINITY_DN4930_c0_g3_i1.p1 TRINITY_DN4930_c0_g3~~TRINITY_DN4930_c0_g3_i1.p1  ORF type:complete len:416 (+),score=71.35 TRINITY_DN4930_c0_g3_i1:59-1249(+)
MAGPRSPAPASGSSPANANGNVNRPGKADAVRVALMQKLAYENGWLLTPANIHLADKIGHGSTSDIFRATLYGLEVAVKCIRPQYLSAHPAGVESFLQEVQLLGRLRHPFVLQMMGAVIKPPSHCWVVTELLPGGTLMQWLHGSSSRDWRRTPPRPLPPPRDRLRVAFQISLAMEYLHAQTPAVVHRDLKPSNIFMDTNGNARVADFGFARFMSSSEDETLTGETGTYIYMAPEVVRHDKYNEKCDVYSFGVLLNELLCGDVPYADAGYTPLQIACGVAEGRIRPSLGKPYGGVTRTMLQLVQECWSQEPSKRPPFRDVSVRLKSFTTSIALSNPGSASSTPPLSPTGMGARLETIPIVLSTSGNNSSSIGNINISSASSSGPSLRIFGFGKKGSS